jgi:hypothetical protein
MMPTPLHRLVHRRLTPEPCLGRLNDEAPHVPMPKRMRPAPLFALFLASSAQVSEVLLVCDAHAPMLGQVLDEFAIFFGRDILHALIPSLADDMHKTAWIPQRGVDRFTSKTSTAQS